MLLGDLLAQLYDDAGAEEIILRLDDLRLLAATREEAEAEGLDLAEFLRAVVRRYAAQASEEEWLTMMGLISRASDPGLTCLRRILEGALREAPCATSGAAPTGGAEERSDPQQHSSVL